VKYDELIEKVSERAGVPPDQAKVLTTATLQTLAERITGGEARDLAAQLPKAMQEPLRKTGEAAEAFSLDEFIRRVAERAGLQVTEARDGVRPVFTTSREAVSGGEFRDVLAQLPKEYRELVHTTGKR
jgi:uncharacterized protein (DUF2267 family)